MHHPISLVSAAIVGLTLTAASANAQSWTNARQTPRVTDILEVDQTGESGWPFGSEDVAGDGLGIFTAVEQGHDLRSAYVDTASGRLWLRVYVSSENQPPTALKLFLFIDSDANPSTGGPAHGATLDPRLDDDPSSGGYEHVVVLTAAVPEPTIWDWSDAELGYVEAAIPDGRAEQSRGTDVDPLQLGESRHGYLQVEVDLAAIGTTDGCASRLFVRSVTDDDGAGDGDQELGEKNQCIAADTDSDGVLDPYVPAECSRNDDCPLWGLCVDGHCALPRACEDDPDCRDDEICTVDGRCVAAGGAECDDSEDCDGLVCDGGECVACTPNGSDCGPNALCGPDGLCVPSSDTAGAGGDSGRGDGGGGAAGLSLEEGEEVSGGAFRCTVTSQRPSLLGVILGASSVLLLSRRRGQRRGQRHTGAGTARGVVGGTNA